MHFILPVLLVTTLLGTLQNYKIPQDSIPCTLGQKKCIVCKEYRICVGCNGIWAVLRIPKYDIPLDFSRYRENGLTFLNRVFATCFKFSWSNTMLPGALDLDPGSQGKSMNSWCVSFEAECITHYKTPPLRNLCLELCHVYVPEWRPRQTVLFFPYDRVTLQNTKQISHVSKIKTSETIRMGFACSADCTRLIETLMAFQPKPVDFNMFSA